MMDTLSLLAASALGWGLSLVAYRPIARVSGWPMGALHLDFPMVPVAAGIVSIAIAILFASTRGSGSELWSVAAFGILLAIFWTGFLRVGSQTSLLLAPLAALLVIFGWLS